MRVPKQNNRFARNTGCYTCIGCNKKTRDTGDNGPCQLCPVCYERDTLENSLSDNGWGQSGDLSRCTTVAEIRAEYQRIKTVAEAEAVA